MYASKEGFARRGYETLFSSYMHYLLSFTVAIKEHYMWFTLRREA